MSTDAQRPSRREQARRRRIRAYLGAFAIVLAVLALAGAAAGAVGTLQGPRVTNVQFDSQAAVSTSGSRLILTTTQTLTSIDPSQVTVSPVADFAVETSGRSIGVRFTLPLRDDTDYTVTVSGVTGQGSDAAVTLTESFRTPPLSVYLLQRGDDGENDTVFRTSLSGEDAVPVFTHRHIEDFRATSAHLVMSVVDDDGSNELIVTDPDGTGQRSLPLPGTGPVQDLQTADRGETIGYTYTDPDMSAAGARASVLYTASLKPADADTPPTRIDVSGEPASVAQWSFVPDTDSILMLSFQGRLLLAPPSGANPVDLGAAAQIEGIARGSTTAIVLRADGLVTISLVDGSEEPLVSAQDATGYLGGVVPLTGDRTLRQYTDPNGAGSSLLLVDGEGHAKPVFTVAASSALLQTCVSPSGRYAAVLVQPDAAKNPYVTSYALPVPETVETHILDLDSETEVSSLGAFDISWCRVPLR
ncbi:hypothetical protein QE374_001716 [Microbacterium sp. SORGH_AS428]|uniref:hypothetical protein n=1 Tax=Microbacterium sp. SORGH_AS_0428 TaxID=3041788 RepID=UPI002859755D|nr:hypothetical protein [Microbacterium sp. SORGH_AS_0428]MDR6199807.1 hypothetical protein [Microbacterium sp. SORGH_AS_0428]